MGTQEAGTVTAEHIFWCGGTAGGTETSLNGIHVSVPDLRGAIPEDFDCEPLLATLRCGEGVKDFCREHKQFFYEAWNAVQLIEKMDRKPVIIVGHSQGCIHALLVALLLNYRTAVICLAPPYTHISNMHLAMRSARAVWEDIHLRSLQTQSRAATLRVIASRGVRLAQAARREGRLAKQKLRALNAKTLDVLLSLCANERIGIESRMNHQLSLATQFCEASDEDTTKRVARGAVVMRGSSQEGKIVGVHFFHMTGDRLFPSEEVPDLRVWRLTQKRPGGRHSTDDWVLSDLDLQQLVRDIDSSYLRTKIAI